jgi:hypothetical protein
MFASTPSASLTILNIVSNHFTRSASSTNLNADEAKANNSGGNNNNNTSNISTSTSASAKDILQIHNCINQFIHCLDSGDGDLMASLFIEENPIVCVTKIEKEYKGKEEIEQFCESVHDTFVDVSHWESNIVIHFNEDDSQASNNSYWKAIKAGNIIAYGTHDDLFTRDGNHKWKFVERQINHLWTATHS